MCREAFASIKLFIIGNIINQLLGGFPSKAGIRDGFAIHAVANFLVAFHKVAFYHHALYQFVNVGIKLPAVHHFFYNSDLLFILLGRIAVIGINDCSGIF